MKVLATFRSFDTLAMTGRVNVVSTAVNFRGTAGAAPSPVTSVNLASKASLRNASPR